MTTNCLFDSKVRTDTKPSKHNDNTFDFFDRSADIRFAKIRSVLNSWFERYPPHEKKELKIRFKKTFDPAFYELFIHELFLKQGYQVTVHPQIEATSKRPDFLMSKRGFEFYLEAKVAKDKSQTELSIDNRINAFYDSLNKLKSPNFFIGIEKLNFKTQRQPNVRKAIKFFESQINQLNPDAYDEIINRSDLDSLPRFEFENNDFSIMILAIPKSKKGRGVEGLRPIGMYPFTTSIGSSDENIKKALEQKATRYGILDKPYIICLNSFSEKGTGEFDVMNALFGSLQFVTYTNRNNPSERHHSEERAKNGFFYGARGAQFTRVSGILITQIHIGNIHNCEHWFVKHPFANKPIDFNFFDLSHIEIIAEKIEHINKKDIGNILQLAASSANRSVP